MSVGQGSGVDLALEAMDLLSHGPWATFDCWCPLCKTKHYRVLRARFQFSRQAKWIHTELFGIKRYFVFPCLKCSAEVEEKLKGLKEVGV